MEISGVAVGHQDEIKFGSVDVSVHVQKLAGVAAPA